MTRRTWQVAIALGTACVATAAPAAAGGKLAALSLAPQARPLLAGRLLIRLPRVAKTEPLPYDVMSAPDPVETSTRYLIDAGPERLVVVAEELFALAGAELAQRAPLELPKPFQLAAANAHWEPVRVTRDKLRVLRVTPKTRDDHPQAILLEGAVVANTDGTVQTVAAYVNPRGARDRAGVAKLARAILATLAPGKRLLARQAGERRLALDARREIVATVPADVVLVRQDGPDFRRHSFYPLHPLGERRHFVQVLVDRHPARGEDGAQSTGRRSTVKGTLLGQPVVWTRWDWEGPGRGEVHVRGEVTLPGGGRFPAVVHAWSHARNAKEAALAKAILDSLRLATR